MDFQPLNKYCRWEEFISNTPSKQAQSVPMGVWKMVTNTWNRYHSVPLRKEDCHLTTFITPWGRHRYLRNPQGFAGAGNGYNWRFNAVLADFNNKERCVYVTVFWDKDTEEHWWRVIKFLETVA